MELATNGGSANGHQAAKDERRDTKESTVSKISDWSAAGAGGGAAPGDAPEAAAVAAHFVQQPWHRRFGAQFVALTWKNLLISWRNWRATLLRILAPL